MSASVPSVMISSTIYDLKQIRADLQRFIKEDLGYDVLCSDSHSFPVDPTATAIENSIKRVRCDADILVLIIGDRYGCVDHATGKGVTHLEYQTARSKGIPVYVFVQRDVLSSLDDWRRDPNRKFAHIIDNRLFEFINEVADQSQDNVWVTDFLEADDIVAGLRTHFAVLMCDGLNRMGRWLSIGKVKAFRSTIESNVNYKNWRFRINWPLADYGNRLWIDAYSREVHWRRLLGALVAATQNVSEIGSVFGAMKRAVEANWVPPRKLSGAILFRETSRATLESVQRQLGSRPYEKRKRKDVVEEDDLENCRKHVLIPFKYIADVKSHDLYNDTQGRIARTASLVCKNVLCSTYQISISHAMCLRGERGRSLLAMACTARNTNKESLAVVSEIPVVIINGSKIEWYGQPGMLPTTEFRSHWAYHRAVRSRAYRDAIVHFHPIELLEWFERLTGRMQAPAGQQLRGLERIAADNGVMLRIFDQYDSIPARDPRFGEYMAEVAASLSGKKVPVVTIWKPNHGVWLSCSGKIEDQPLRDALIRIDQLAAIFPKELV